MDSIVDPIWSEHILAITADPSHASLVRHVSAMIEQVRQMNRSVQAAELKRIGASLFEIGYYWSMEKAKTPRPYDMLPAPYSTIVYLGYEMDTEISDDPGWIIAKAEYLCSRIIAEDHKEKIKRRAALVEAVLDNLESRFGLLALEPVHHIFCVPEIGTAEPVFGYGGNGWTLQMINAHPESSDDNCVIESVVRIMTDHAMSYIDPIAANKLLHQQLPHQDLDAIDVWVPAYIDAIKSSLLFRSLYAQRLHVAQDRKAAEWQNLILKCVEQVRSDG